MPATLDWMSQQGMRSFEMSEIVSRGLDDVLHEAIAIGAHGYLLKENDGASLIAAITRVAAGHSVLDPSLADQVLNLMKRGWEPVPVDRLAILSTQERRVLAQIAAGLTNKEVGVQLGLSEKTVKNYLANIFAKLNVTRRSQAAAVFARESRPVRS